MGQEDLLALLDSTKGKYVDQHVWKRIKHKNGPALSCQLCGWTWLAHQDPKRIGRCNPERKQDAAPERSRRSAPQHQAEGRPQQEGQRSVHVRQDEQGAAR